MPRNIFPRKCKDADIFLLYFCLSLMAFLSLYIISMVACNYLWSVSAPFIMFIETGLLSDNDGIAVI